MKKMNAWVLEAPQRLRLQTVDVPSCKDNELLIRVCAMCICNGSDPSLYLGNEDYPMPYVFGHEAVGVIEQAGADVTGFHTGQRVIWWCTTGAFGRYVSAQPDKVSMFVVPEHIPDSSAAMLELVIAASRALMPFTENAKGKSLRILGLGPSGLVSVMYAKALGFSYVEGWDLCESRRSLAIQLGADSVYDPSVDDFRVDALPKADVSLDMAADDPIGNSLTLLCRCAQTGSTIVSYGHPIHGRHFSPYVFQKASLTLRSPENDHRIIRQKGRQVMDWVADGTIQLTPLISDVRPFARLGESFAEMLKHPWDHLKLVFHFEEE